MTTNKKVSKPITIDYEGFKIIVTQGKFSPRTYKSPRWGYKTAYDCNRRAVVYYKDNNQIEQWTFWRDSNKKSIAHVKAIIDINKTSKKYEILKRIIDRRIAEKESAVV